MLFITLFVKPCHAVCHAMSRCLSRCLSRHVTLFVTPCHAVCHAMSRCLSCCLSRRLSRHVTLFVTLFITLFVTLFITLPFNSMKELSQDMHFVLHNCSQFKSIQSLHISRTVQPTHYHNVSQSPLLNHILHFLIFYTLPVKSWPNVHIHNVSWTSHFPYFNLLAPEFYI